MNMRRTGVVAGASLAAVAGLAAVLSSAGLLDADEAAKAGSSALSLYGGVATVVHTGADGAVLGTQSVHNALVDTGEDFLLRQVFRDGMSEGDNTQIGAICLSADAPDTANVIPETWTFTNFNDRHAADYSQGGATNAAPTNTLECLTDTTVTMSGQIATLGPLTFNATDVSTGTNWVPGQEVRLIGVCKASSTGAAAAACTDPLFAAVDINDVRLNDGETLTVTYTFDMRSQGS